MSNIKRLTHRQFIKEVAKKSNRADLDSAEKYIKAFIDVLADEIKMAGVCHVRGLGTFKVMETGGRFKKVPHPHGGCSEKWIEPTISISFSAVESLKDVINDKMESPETRRLKKLEAKRALRELEEQLELQKKKEAKRKEVQEKLLVDRRNKPSEN